MPSAKTIALDCDGVMYDFQGAFRYMANAYLGVGMPPVEEFWFKWESPKEFLTPEQWEWMWNEGVKLGLYRYGHIVKGAVVACREMTQGQHNKLVVATHRPGSAVNDTLDFLRYMAGSLWEWSGVYIMTSQEPKSIVDADILVDDKSENLLEWASTGRLAIRFEQPWNHGLMATNMVQADGWQEVVAHVAKAST